MGICAHSRMQVRSDRMTTRQGMQNALHERTSNIYLRRHRDSVTRTVPYTKSTARLVYKLKFVFVRTLDANECKRLHCLGLSTLHDWIFTDLCLRLRPAFSSGSRRANWSICVRTSGVARLCERGMEVRNEFQGGREYTASTNEQAGSDQRVSSGLLNSRARCQSQQ